MNRNKLPEVNLPYECDAYDLNTFLFYSSDIDRESYYHLNTLIWDYVGADCWAISVKEVNIAKEQVVYNSYPCKNKSIRKEIVEDLVRNEIIENPHSSLLVHIIRRKQNARIRLFMGQELTTTMNIDYKVNHKVFQISFSQSEAHKDYFKTM